MYYSDALYGDCVVTKADDWLICKREGTSNIIVIEKNEIGLDKGDYLFCKVKDFKVPTYRK